MSTLGPLLYLLVGAAAMGWVAMNVLEDEDDDENEEDDSTSDKGTGASTPEVTEPEVTGTPSGDSQVGVGADGPDFVNGTAGDDYLSDIDFDNVDLDAIDDAIDDAEETGDYDAALALMESELGLDEVRSDDDDTVDGQSGDDEIDAFFGADIVYGGAGHDVVNTTDWSATPGEDTIYGGAGDDEIFVDNGDVVFGGSGYDYVEIDGYHNDVDDREEAPVVFADFEAGTDILEYYINWDEETDDWIFPLESAMIAVQMGNDVHVGLETPDAPGEMAFTVAILSDLSKADVDQAIAADEIYAY